MKATTLIRAIFIAGTTLMITGVIAQQIKTDPKEVKPVKVGDDLPDVTVRSVAHAQVKLRDAVGGKPTVLILYRGGWCPYCNAHLKELAGLQAELKKMGYQTIGISPDRPEELAKSIEGNKLDYRLLSDSKIEVAKALGLAFRVDDKTFKLYRDTYKIDLERYSGETHHVLPVPALLLVDAKGKIRFIHFDPDYKKRLSSENILKEARKALLK